MTTIDQKAAFSLAESLARGELKAALTWAGQGQPVLGELAALVAEAPAGRAWVEAAEARLQRWWAERELRWSGLYTAPPRLMRWLTDEASRPDPGFLQSTQLTNPLIFLTQILRYKALFDEGLSEAMRGSAIPVLAGHSQGIMPALLVAESPGGDVHLDRMLAYLDYMLWQGFTMARCYHAPGAGAPMAAVSGLPRDELAREIEAINARLPAGEALTITLENTRTRSVVSGRPLHLELLRIRLEERGKREQAARKAGKHAGRLAKIQWEALAVGGPFHSPYMAPGLAAMREAVRALGFRVEAAALERTVLSTIEGAPFNEAGDLTERLLVAQFVSPVRWAAVVEAIGRTPGLDVVLDLGPGDGVARLTRANLRGSGLPVLALSPPEGAGIRNEATAALLSPGRPLPPKPPRYADFAPGLARLPDGRVVVDNRYTRATGQPPLILPGMTPTTVDAPIVAAAANAGFTAELAGGGQVTEAIFWRRMDELTQALEPGREFTFNALYLDPYLWDLHVRKAGLIFRARRLGYPVCGLTISAGVPPLEEATRLLDQLRDVGLWLNALKPGTVAQVEAVVKIARARPDHPIFLHLEGGKAGGHHSWEDLDQLLLDTYAPIRETPNLVLCVGGGVATPERATALLRGTWARRHGAQDMPVDAVFLGTLAMATLEATASPQVKAALVAARGTNRWVYAGQAEGDVTSGRSQLDADIHYLDNAAARAGRLLDEVAGDAGAIEARRTEIIEALNRTAKPYFGDLEAMTWEQVLSRAIALMAVGEGGPYEDGPWPDRSYRERVAMLMARCEARLCGQDRGEVGSIFAPGTAAEALDRPAEALERVLAAYPQARVARLLPGDARAFIHQICARPGKPVNFVPVIDASVRRWYKSDSLWQAQVARYPADAVLVIPGPEAVAGLDRADEPVAELLGRFTAALAEDLHRDGVAPLPCPLLRRPERAPAWPEGLLVREEEGGFSVQVRAAADPVAWRDALTARLPAPLGPALATARWRVNGRSIENPLPGLLRPEAGASLRLRSGQLRYVPAEAGREALLLTPSPEGLTLEVSAGPAAGLRLSIHALPAASGPWAGDGAFGLERQEHRDAIRGFYWSALFSGVARPVPLFEPASATVSLEGERARAYAALIGAPPEAAPLELAFSLLWEPLFRVLAADDLAGGLLRLVHLDNRLVPGPLWPPAADLGMHAEARVTRVEEQEAGRTVEIRGELSADGARVALLESRFFIRRSPLDGARPPLRAWEPLEAALDLGEAEAGYLLERLEGLAQGVGGGGDRPLIRPSATFSHGEKGKDNADLSLDPQAGPPPAASTLPLSPERGRAAAGRYTLRGWLREERPIVGLPRFGADLQLFYAGRPVASLRFDLTADLQAHPVRAVLTAIQGPRTRRAPDEIETSGAILGEREERAPAELATFAEVGGDQNPIHQSPMAARLAGLDRPIVHGMWTGARLHAFALETSRAAPAHVRDLRVDFLDIVLPGEPLMLSARRAGRASGDAIVEAVANVRRGESTRAAARARLRLAPPRTALVFPGQGVQRQGMGMDTMARSPAARRVWEEAERFTTSELGFSILTVVRDNPRTLLVRGETLTHPEGVLHLTAFTQVALAVLANAEVADLREGGVLPMEFEGDVVTAGHSLGEYNALGALAGVLSLETVIRAVYARGQTMHRMVPRDARGESGYRMGVLRPNLVGMSDADVRALVETAATRSGAFAEIVNYNVRGRQYSVVGEIPALEALIRLLPPGPKDKPAWLWVPGIDVPFHSRRLAHGVAAFRETLERNFPDPEPCTRLIGRYIPNLVGRLFTLERDFIDAVVEKTGDRGIRALEAGVVAGTTTPAVLAHRLLIELLAWQFASPVRWMQTQELMLAPRAYGGLGVQRLVEIGPGHAQTLANMARATLAGFGPGAPVVTIWNAEADRAALWGEDAPAEPEPEAPTPAPARPAPVQAAAPAPVASSSVGPPPDRAITALEALEILLALQTKVRPEQIRGDETVESLFEGVSSRRNQALMDIGAEFQAGALDGAHEKPLRDLGGEIARRAPGWKAPGRYLRAAGDDALRRIFGRAGLNRKELGETLAERYGFGPGLIEATILLLATEAREGSSSRGGALGALHGEVPADRGAALALVERAAGVLAERWRFALPSAGGGEAGAGVDPAAIGALEKKILGPEGPLLGAAEALAGRLGHRVVPASGAPVAGIPEPDANAEKLAMLEAEHGADYAALVAPRFDRDKHVALTSAWAWAQRDVARLSWRLLRGEDPDRLRPEAGRLAAHASEPRVAQIAAWYAGIAGSRGRSEAAALLGRLSRGEGSAALPLQPGSPRATVHPDGRIEAWEERISSADPREGWLSALWPAQGPALVDAPRWNADWAGWIRAAGQAPLPFAGRTALVTGASPGSIAGELVRHLLRGGARVLATTSTYGPERLAWFRRLYAENAGPGAELHVVPFNQASLRDVDALLDWTLNPQIEASGGSTKVHKGPWLPDLVLPFAALRDLGMLPALEARSQAALRALLLGVERLIAGLGAHLVRAGMPARPITALLPLSPNHGGFGGDGTYGEGKAGLEALLEKKHSEAEVWGRAVHLVGARIGWVRGTGLMDAHDAVAARLEQMTGIHTFSVAEMGLLLASLVVAESPPASADLTGGFSALGDVGGTVRRAREGLAAEAALAKRRTQLRSSEEEALGRPPAPAPIRALPAPSDASTRAAPSWPGQPAALDRMIAVVGMAELGPWGSSRTRYEIEVHRSLSAAGVLELAWMCGLVRYQEDAHGGGWVDVDSGEPVAEEAVAERYEAAVRSRSGLRFFDPAAAGYDPTDLPVLEPIYLERDLRFPVAGQDEARSFVAADPEHTVAEQDAEGSWTVTRRAGTLIRVPRRHSLRRRAAGVLPDGFDPKRWGIPAEMADRLDRLALVNLVATVEAFLTAGCKPDELMSRLHPAAVGNTQGGGIGGMRSLRRLYSDLMLGNERQPDILQETLINVIAAHVVQSYVGSYGPMSHPVGACASAAVSLEEAQDKILGGRAEFIVAGGFDDLGPEGALGFQDMAATADSEDALAHGIEPAALSRPNDRRRRGFVESQGGGTLLLCRGDVAMALGLPVYGVLAYAGSYGDGLHRSIPAPGQGLLAAAQGGARSPLGRALSSHGLTTDDIAVVYKHDTSTNANDLNEGRIHHSLQRALGRSVGNPLWVVSQKALTGHAKGGSAAWQAVGLLQALVDGVVPGNPNLESVDEAMRGHEVLGWTDATLRPVEPLRAGLLTSLGFGHVNAIALLLHPDAFRAALSPEQLADWEARSATRRAVGERDRQAAMMGERPAYVRPPDRRFAAADGTDALTAEEAAILLDADARLDAATGTYQRGES